MELGGYQVKKGMRILLPAWSIHMDPKYWPDPDKFDPERSVERGWRSPGEDRNKSPIFAGLGHPRGPPTPSYMHDLEMFDPERSVERG